MSHTPGCFQHRPRRMSIKNIVHGHILHTVRTVCPNMRPRDAPSTVRICGSQRVASRVTALHARHGDVRPDMALSMSANFTGTCENRMRGCAAHTFVATGGARCGRGVRRAGMKADVDRSHVDRVWCRARAFDAGVCANATSRWVRVGWI